MTKNKKKYFCIFFLFCVVCVFLDLEATRVSLCELVQLTLHVFKLRGVVSFRVSFRHNFHSSLDANVNFFFGLFCCSIFTDVMVVVVATTAELALILFMLYCSTPIFFYITCYPFINARNIYQAKPSPRAKTLYKE